MAKAKKYDGFRLFFALTFENEKGDAVNPKQEQERLNSCFLFENKIDDLTK